MNNAQQSSEASLWYALGALRERVAVLETAVFHPSNPPSTTSSPTVSQTGEMSGAIKTAERAAGFLSMAGQVITWLVHAIIWLIPWVWAGWGAFEAFWAAKWPLLEALFR